MVNFSVVGRNANNEQRADYFKYDTLTNERNIIAKNFNFLFPSIKATVGGETGIDFLKSDKNIIFKYFLLHVNRF